MTAALRVAVVGTGYFSRFHLDAWTRIPGVRLAATCDVDATKARAAAEAHGAGRWFDDPAVMLDAIRPDIVDIVTPPPTHLALIRAAATAGATIICQKAFCTGLPEAMDAVAVAKAASVRLVVHENFRFQPWYGEIRRRLLAGDLGTPFQAAFRLRPGDGQGADAYLDRQPYFRTMERFLVHETAIHFIDTFRYLFGEAEGVFADLRRLNPAIAGEDAGFLLFRHAGGVRSLFDGNRLVDHAAANRRLTMGEFLVEGSEGTIRLDGDGRLRHRRRGANDETAIPYAWDDTGFGGDCVRRLQQHVVDHLTAGTPLQNEAVDYLANLRLEEAVYRSAAEGRIVPV